MLICIRTKRQRKSTLISIETLKPYLSRNMFILNWSSILVAKIQDGVQDGHWYFQFMRYLEFMLNFYDLGVYHEKNRRILIGLLNMRYHKKLRFINRNIQWVIALCVKWLWPISTLDDFTLGHAVSLFFVIYE